MADKKGTQSEFSTCFEELPFAERMQKMMNQKGMGSLCAERMKKVMEQKEAAGSNCSERMQEMMKDCCRVPEEPEKSKKEGCHGRKE